MEERIFVDKGL
jgi:hypothetical protein